MQQMDKAIKKEMKREVAKDRNGKSGARNRNRKRSAKPQRANRGARNMPRSLANERRSPQIPPEYSLTKAAYRMLDSRFKQAMPRSGLNKQQAKAVLQAVLPYTSNSIRVRPVTGYMGPTAMAKNYEQRDINLTSIFNAFHLGGDPALGIDPEAAIPTYQVGMSAVPLYAAGADGLLGFTVAHFHDAYLLGIIPSYQPAPGGDPVTYHHSQAYQARSFINENTGVGTLATVAGSEIALAVPAGTTLPCMFFNLSTDTTITTNSISANPRSLGLQLAPSSFGLCSSVANMLGTASVSQSVGAYGDIHPCVTWNGQRAFWLDSCAAQAAGIGVAILCNSNASIPANSLFLRVERVNFGSLTTDITTEIFSNEAFTAAPVSGLSWARCVVLSSGYYIATVTGNFNTISPGIDATFQIAMTFRTTTAIVSRHVLNKNLPVTDSQTRALVNKVQVNGASLLLSNMEATIVRGGRVYCAEGNTNYRWFDYFTNPQDLIATTATQLGFDGDWAEGAYGFVKGPMGKMRDVVVHPDPGGVSYVNCYVNTSSENQLNSLLGSNYYYITPATTGQPGNLSTAPRIKLQFCISYEYTSDSQMVELGVPALSSNEVATVGDFLMDYNIPFSENKFHLSTFLSEVMSKVRGAASKALPWSKHIAEALQVFPHPLANTIGRVLSGVNGIADQFTAD